MAGRTVKMRGNPLPVAGPELHVGDRAPDFKLHQRGPDGLCDVTLRDYAGKTLVLSVVPSLDTPVCEAQTKRFDEEAARLTDLLSRLVNPALMLIMGVLIGGIIVLMYLPIFQLVEQVQ